MLSKEQILAAADLPVSTVEVPEWGGSVRVRGMTGLELAEFQGAIGNGKKAQSPHILALLVAFSVIDEAGARMFTADQVAALSGKSVVALNRVAAVAQRLNGMDAATADGLEKNSEGRAPDSSSTS